MTVSTHTYTAQVTARGVTASLDITGGSITVDASSTPLVNASITITTPARATLDMLDPRDQARVTITCRRDQDTPRTFDLTLRSRTRTLTEGTIALTLTSDEALLGDWAPLADDWAPYTQQNSLTGIVNYVLGQAIPGASLSNPDAGAAGVFPFWTATNLIDNPSFTVDAAHWYPSTNAASVNLVTGGTHGTGRLQIVSTKAGQTIARADAVDVTPGAIMQASLDVITFAGQPATTAWLVLHCQDSMGRLTNRIESAHENVDSTGYVTLSTSATMPARTAQLALYVVYQAAAATTYAYIDSVQIIESPMPVGYFDGDTARSPQYSYAWNDTPGDSPSTRTVLVPEVDPESLRWQAGQTALDFLTPLVQSHGMRLVCDTDGVWTLRDTTWQAPGQVDMIVGANLIDGTDDIDVDGGGWFDAQVTRYTWTDVTGMQHVKVDSYTANPQPVRVSLIDTTSAWPGAGRSEYAVQRAAQLGRAETGTLVADWATRVDQLATLRLADTTSQVGTIQAVTFNLDRDEMTISTRTREVPATAWLLQPAGAWTAQPAQTWKAAAA